MPVKNSASHAPVLGLCKYTLVLTGCKEFHAWLGCFPLVLHKYSESLHALNNGTMLH
jgi:hypothetical protein